MRLFALYNMRTVASSFDLSYSPRDTRYFPLDLEFDTINIQQKQYQSKDQANLGKVVVGR